MTVHLGMRGTGNYTQTFREPLDTRAQVELMFGARFYVCGYCGTKYESLPTLQGAVKCRNCGSNSMKEE